MEAFLLSRYLSSTMRSIHPSIDFEVGTVRSGRGKVIAHSNMTLEVEGDAFEGEAVVALLPSAVRNPGPELVPRSLAYTAHSPQSYTGKGSHYAHGTGTADSKAGIYRYGEGRDGTGCVLRRAKTG